MNTRRTLYTVAALTLFCIGQLHAQTAIIAGRVVSAGDDGAPVIGASIRIEESTRGAVADASGMFRIARLEPGAHTLSISSIGYASLDTTVVVRAGDSLFVIAHLDEEETEAEEVVVTGTRTQRTISDVPVRVEAIPQEEVEEKILMAPANVAMLLNESTGMRVQTTSPTTSTANLRIQGLPGRYTQVLTDGIPNVGGLGAGLGLTELPPLNLRQVEVIKGAASALYGADAIAGVVNLITKDPRPEPELSALVNVTSQKGLDLAAYGGATFGDLGVTLMASRNTQPRFDVDGDGFADVPEYERLTVYPKIVLSLSDAMKLDVALGFIADDRLGGAMTGERTSAGSDAPYLESISSERFSGAAQWSWNLAEDQSLVVKAAAMSLDRDAYYGTSAFNAAQHFAYGEAQYGTAIGDHSLLVAGVISMDRFDDETIDSIADRSYRYITPSLLAQDEYRISDEWTALVSGRVDFHNTFGTFITPRVSIMYRPSPSLTMRIGGGTGYKAPTIFIEEVEEQGFADIALVAGATVEKAQSGTFDVNWKTVIGESVGLNINAAAYATQVRDALRLSPRNSVHNAGDILSRGAEVSAKLNYEEFKLSLGYTFLHATRDIEEFSSELELNPRHSLGAVLMWESEEAGAKAGLESYFTGAQRISHPSRETSPSYWVMGLLIEKAFGPVRLFINFENFTDTRQTRFERIIIGDPAMGPVEALPIYAPLEGRVINGGVRFVL
jgi:outer membrane receptor for ferrienterochelin and colicins